MFGALFSVFFLATACLAQDSAFKFVLEKCELASYNEEYIKDFSIDCKSISPYTFKVSGKGELLKEINMDDTTATGQVHVYDGSTYVAKPNLKLTVPICDEYKSQTFGLWQEIEKFGNIKGCGPHPPGVYEVKEFTPKLRIDNIPIAAREGKYMLSIKGNQNKVDMMQMNIYVAVEK